MRTPAGASSADSMRNACVCVQAAQHRLSQLPFFFSPGIAHVRALRGLWAHTSAYVSIRQHTSAYVSVRQRTSAFLFECLFERLLRSLLVVVSY